MRETIEKLKKIWDICNVEIIAGVLFAAAVACFIYDGTFIAAIASGFIVGVLIAFGLWRYRNLTAVVPVHSALRKAPAKAKAKRKPVKRTAKRPAKKTKKKTRK